MAAITIPIPDAVYPRVIAALAAHHPEPGLTADEAAAAMVADYIYRVVSQYEEQQAADQARAIAAARSQRDFAALIGRGEKSAKTPEPEPREPEPVRPIEDSGDPGVTVERSG